MKRRAGLLTGIVVSLISAGMVMSQTAVAQDAATVTEINAAQSQTSQQTQQTESLQPEDVAARAKEADKAKEQSESQQQFDSSLFAMPKAASSVTPDKIKASLDNPNITAVDLPGENSGGGIAIGGENYGIFPSAGKDYLILSTGLASDVFKGTDKDQASTDLNTPTLGADGNDMSQVRVTLAPPENANCLAVDFQFMSEEYPEFVGSRYNDIFTAELNESKFELKDNQVSSPYNFAFDKNGKSISINTVSGMVPNTGTHGWGIMDGTTDPLTATTPIKKDANGNMTVILSIQDLGDSIYDSAVVVDNFHWLNQTCEAGAVSKTDSDGDGLYDDWETKGIDYNNDGKIDLDLPAMGADPYKPDIFVEADYMVNPKDKVAGDIADSTGLTVHPELSYQLRPKDVKLISDTFYKAPVVTTTSHGTAHGINLHIDAGPDTLMNPETGEKWGKLSQSNAVKYVNNLHLLDEKEGLTHWDGFDAIKQFDTNRRRVFHYAIMGTSIVDGEGNALASGLSRSLGYGDNNSSGRGGQDFYVAAEYLHREQLRTDEMKLDDGVISRTFMHELGHNLGLNHGGGDDTGYKPNYISIMNYFYQLRGLLTDKNNVTQADIIDYSSVKLPDLDEQKLDESVGIDPQGQYQNTGLGAGWVCTTKDERKTESQIPIARQYVDFNCNGNSKLFPEHSVKNDIDGNGRYGIIYGYNDWAHLVYKGGSIGAPGDVNVQLPETTSVKELSEAEAIEKDVLGAPGTARATVIGPFTVIKGVSGQKLFVNVENMSHEADDFTVEVSGDVFDSPQLQKIHVDGSTTLPLTSKQVSFPLKADAGEGDHLITVKVTGSTGRSIEQTTTVNVITLSEADRQELIDVLKKGNTGLSDMVTQQYLTVLSSSFTPSGQTPNTGNGSSAGDNPTGSSKNDDSQSKQPSGAKQASNAKQPSGVKRLTNTGIDISIMAGLALLCIIVGTTVVLRRKTKQ